MEYNSFSIAEANLGSTEMQKVTHVRVIEDGLNSKDIPIGNFVVPIESPIIYNRKIKSINQELDKNTLGTDLTKIGVVISPSIVGSDWDAAIVESPCVWYDDRLGKYCMTYVGYSGTKETPLNAAIGLATSDSLLGVWDKDALNPILGASNTEGLPDYAGCTGGTIWYEEGLYYMFYIGLTDVGYEQGTASVCLATSSDLYLWTRLGSVVSPYGAGWRAGNVFHASVTKVDNTYYLFFNAAGQDGIERIGYATSINLLSWAVDDTNSPLLNVGVAGTWDHFAIGDPSVYYIDGNWYMAYYGSGSNGAQDGLAWTTKERFPLGWSKYEGNPVLKIGTTYDNVHAHKPFIYTDGFGYYHFYTALNSDSVRLIALASDIITASDARKKFQMFRCAESLRSIALDYYSIVADSSCLISTEGKSNIKIRYYARCEVTAGSLFILAATITTQGATYLDGSEIVIEVSDWTNHISDWIPFNISRQGTNNLNNYAIYAHVSTGGAASIGQVQFELSWY